MKTQELNARDKNEEKLKLDSQLKVRNNNENTKKMK